MSDNGNNGAGTALAPIIDTDTGEIIEGPSASQRAEQLLHNISELAHLIEESADIATTIALRNKAEAIQFLTRKIDLESEIKNQATLSVIAARRRLGVLTMAMPTAQGARTDLTTSLQPDGKFEELAEQGLTESEVRRNETLAQLPDDKLAAFVDEKLADGYEITVGGVLQYARHVINGDPLKTSKSYEWYTPGLLMERVRQVLGSISFDPCSTQAANKIVKADWYASLPDDDGLKLNWEVETVYMNPPYGETIGKWVDKLVEAVQSGGVGSAIALLPNRTDTTWFKALRNYPRCHIDGRLKFWGPGDKGNGATFPSVVVALNCDLKEFAKAFEDLGDIYVRYDRGSD